MPIYQVYPDELYHFGILGMKWGVRRYQNKDGSLTKAGQKRYSDDENETSEEYNRNKAHSDEIKSLSDEELTNRYYRLMAEKKLYDLENEIKKYDPDEIERVKKAKESEAIKKQEEESARKLEENKQKVKDFFKNAIGNTIKDKIMPSVGSAVGDLISKKIKYMISPKSARYKEIESLDKESTYYKKLKESEENKKMYNMLKSMSDSDYKSWKVKDSKKKDDD